MIFAQVAVWPSAHPTHHLPLLSLQAPIIDIDFQHSFHMFLDALAALEMKKSHLGKPFSAKTDVFLHIM